MYVYYTGVGKSTVEGCQGRYILPMLFPLLYVVTNNKKCVTFVNKYRGIINIVFIILLFLINVFCIWRGCLLYYSNSVVVYD